MYFLNPLAFWALFAAAVPILLHLERNRGARTVSLPTVRFLEQLQQQQFWSVRIQEILLLLLRVALVVLLVAAASVPRMSPTGPRWLAALFGTPGVGNPQAVGLLLDCSTSTEYNTGNETLHDALLRRALALLDRLPRGVPLVIAALGGPDGETAPLSTTRHDAARSALRALRTGGPDTPVARSIERMLAALSSYGQSHLFILTDLQATAWQPFIESGAAAGLRGRMVQQQVSCTVLGMSVRQPANLWIDTVSVPALPRPPWLRYSIPVAVGADAAIRTTTGPIQAQVTIRDESGHSLVVPLVLQPKGDQRLQGAIALPIEPVRDRSSIVQRRIQVALARAVEADPLPADNEVLLTLPVAAPVRVLLVSSEVDTFAARAMASALRAGERETSLTGEQLPRKSLFVVTSEARRDLNTASVKNQHVIVIGGGARDLDEAQSSVLTGAVRAGAGLVWLMGDSTSSETQPLPLAVALGLPSIRSTSGEFSMRPARADHPLCRTLSSFPESAWRTIRVARLVSLPEDLETLYEAVAVDGSARAVVAERRYGNGRLLLWATGLDPDASSLAVAPQFVALLQEALVYLAVTGRTSSAGKVDRSATPDESQLASLSPQGCNRLKAELGCALQTDAGPVADSHRKGFALWPEQWLLLLALACALAEARLANRL